MTATPSNLTASERLAEIKARASAASAPGRVGGMATACAMETLAGTDVPDMAAALTYVLELCDKPWSARSGGMVRVQDVRDVISAFLVPTNPAVPLVPTNPSGTADTTGGAS